MTQEEAEKAVKIHEALADRAAAMHYWDEPDYIRVWFDGDRAFAMSAERESGYYGDSYIVKQQIEIEPQLLLMSDDAFAAWLKAKQSERERLQREDAAERAAEAERRERAIYETLKKKYGNAFTR